MANTLHLIVPKRVRQTAHSMKVASADTVFVDRKQWRARRVVRDRHAERVRGFEFEAFTVFRSAAQSLVK